MPGTVLGVLLGQLPEHSVEERSLAGSVEGEWRAESKILVFEACLSEERVSTLPTPRLPDSLYCKYFVSVSFLSFQTVLLETLRTCYELCVFHSPRHHGERWTQVRLVSFLKETVMLHATVRITEFTHLIQVVCRECPCLHTCACGTVKWSCSRRHLHELN